MPSALRAAFVLVPALPLLAALLARGSRSGAELAEPSRGIRGTGWGSPHRRSSGHRAARVATILSAGALLASLVGTAGLAVAGPGTLRWAPFGPGHALALGLRFDVVSAVMAVLVSFLGVAVVRFSGGYLQGDPRQALFVRRLSLTLAAVSTLVLAGDLLVLFASWVATSVGLHALLLHHPERPQAHFSARKKLVVSRLGDLCMLAALVLVYRAYGTFDLEALFARAAAGETAPLSGIGLLFAGCAALKSAQFPFHSWLPDTMETPTPVSALMHAGIINAGGFLVVRLSPLLVHAPRALGALAVVGLVTAGFGAVVMLAQPTVKRALAYSTIAQMGFMLLQCGLGAFGLALVHIVAHSLYKAHAFLSAGSTIGASSRRAVPLRSSAVVLGLAAGIASVGGVFAFAPRLIGGASIPASVFAWVLALAVAYGLARFWSSERTARDLALGVALALGAAALGACAHVVAHVWVAVPPPAPARGVELAACGVFTAIFLFQVVLWRAGGHPIGRALYVHAQSGFYVGTLANRALDRLWPRSPIDPQSGGNV